MGPLKCITGPARSCIVSKGLAEIFSWPWALLFGSPIPAPCSFIEKGILEASSGWEFGCWDCLTCGILRWSHRILDVYEILNNLADLWDQLNLERKARKRNFKLFLTKL